MQQLARGLGGFSGGAIELRDIASTLPFVSLVASVTRIERRAEVRADRPGLVVPWTRGLSRLQREARWRDERVRLELLNRLGVSVAAGEAIASVVPAPDAVVSRTDLRRARKVVQSQQPRRVLEVSEAAVLLPGILAVQADEGDEQTAAGVEEALITLVDHHLRGVRSTRPAPDRLVNASDMPVVPALAAAMKRGIRLAASTDKRSVREAVIGAMRRLLQLGQLGDTLPTLLVGALLYENTASFPGVGALLWEAGSRAIETGDDSAVVMTRIAIEQRLVDDNGTFTTEAVEIGARMVVFACWNDQPAAARMWRWYVDKTATADRSSCLLGAVRAGTAALLAANPSNALRIAAFLDAEIDLGQLKQYIQQPGMVTIEQTVADQYGHYLGADAEAAMTRFLDFAADAMAAVA